MPDRDQSLELLRELRDVGVTPPRLEVLHVRVSSAIAEEIERERHSRRGRFSGSSPGRSPSQRFGGARRRPSYTRLADGLVPVIGVLVVALVVAVFFGLHGSGPSSTAPSRGSVQLVYLAEPSPQARVVTRGALQRTVEIIQMRLQAFGISGAHVSVSSANEITVAPPKASDSARAEQVVGATAPLFFYDWEANVVMPNGKTVASRLQTQDPTAIEISQGSGSASPGSPGARSMGLYQAVLLASKQPYSASSANSRPGSQYYMFGAPGSAACATAARDQGRAPIAGVHCLLSGPADDTKDLDSGLPAGVTPSQGQTLVVKRGTVVFETTPANFAHRVPFSDPNAQFFVLKDNAALSSNDITNPRRSADPSARQLDVTFGFTSTGKTAFKNVTAAIARRGSLVSGLGQTLNQHFAVALDGQLITVPSIDYKQYPDGINGDNGADISGSFTITSARSLAAELRLGAPLNLKPICGGTRATTPCRNPPVR